MIPKAVIKRIMKDCGANRISEDAITTLEEEVVNITEEIVNSSIAVMKHDGRKTLQKKDIKFALKLI